MRRSSETAFVFVLTICWLAASTSHAQIKAFPQAEGFGASATGGRGGDVYHVTNLNDSGEGSLRFGLDNAPASGRTIVFDIGGWITLTSKLGLTKNRVTIAGHTAPGGIGIRNGQFSVGGDDVIVRHMRFRPGKITNTDHDSINTNENAERVIYDHISAEFSTDGGFDLQADAVTLQYSSVSFGLISHSTGGLIQSPTGGAAGELSFHHNMFAHNETRNPKARAEIIDWRDNVIYNYHNGFLAGESETDVNPNWKANFDGNTYVSNVGGNSGSGGRPMMTGGRTQNYDLWFGVNALDRDSDSADDPIVYTKAQAQADQSIVSSAYNWFDTPFAAADVWQSGSPGTAYTRVLQEFGATPWARDAVNQLIHDQVLTRTGQRISNENQLGIANAGYPTLGGQPAPLDTDGDGMPDAWESKHGTNPSVANNNGDFDFDGYTDLEEYLNDLAAFPAIGPLEFTGIGRYADWERWTRRWEPSRVDQVHVTNGAAFVDAVGQKAGTLRIASAAGSNGRLYVTSGWLEVTDGVEVGGGGTGRVEHHGGELRVLAGGVDVTSGEYQLRGGLLRTPELSKGANGQFVFTGGVLQANSVDFSLTNNGGTIAPGSGTAGGIGQMNVAGDLNLNSGALQVELASSLMADAVLIDGTATLGGSLSVAPIGGFSPTAGQTWPILAATSFLGSFSSITPGYSVEQLGNQLWLTLGSGASALNVVIPEPAAVSLVAVGLLGTIMLRHRRRLAVAAVCTVLTFGAVGATQADILQVIADAQLNENSTNANGSGATNTGTGNGTNLNARWNFSTPPTDRNEWIALKFDLSSYSEKARLSNVALRTTMFRTNAINNTTLRLYALTPGVAGEDWPEATIVYGSMPGFTFDAQSTTNILDVGGALASLGTFPVSGVGNEGNVTLINPASLTSFVQGMGNHNLLTLLLSFQNSSGTQWRIASREATATMSNALTGPAGSFAPYLQFDVGATGIGGDYNDNGIVDTGDYVVWRDRLGMGSLPNEEVSPTTVDTADYLYWRERYGATTPGAGGAVLPAAVPEPVSVGLVFTCCIVMQQVRRRTR